LGITVPEPISGDSAKYVWKRHGSGTQKVEEILGLRRRKELKSNSTSKAAAAAPVLWEGAVARVNKSSLMYDVSRLIIFYI